MAQITISVTKRVPFRDSVQEFSNVYTYGSLALHPGESEAINLIDEVVAFEKTIHSTAVSFILGRCWRSGGTQAENVMIAEKTLSGTGATTPLTALDYERAVLLQWPAGLDSLGRPVKLRKWYHTCGQIAGVVFSNAQLVQTIGLTTTQRDNIADAVHAITRIGTEVWGLIADSGRERTGDGEPVTHKYLEHHQFGDQWRG